MTNKLLSDFNNFAKSIPGYSQSEELVDNYLRKKSKPVIGSIIYCNLGFSTATVEHTAIYIGRGQIVELQGKLKGGKITTVDRRQFLKNRNFASHSIWVACYGNSTRAIGDKLVAQRAKEKVGKSCNYHILQENCHRFTSGCITGNFKNNDILFMNLRDTIRQTWGNYNWRVWQ